MRSSPNTTSRSWCPAIINQTAKATAAIAAHKGPCYMRFARAPTPLFTTEATPFEIGKLQIIKEGSDVALYRLRSPAHSSAFTRHWPFRKKESMPW